MKNLKTGLKSEMNKIRKKIKSGLDTNIKSELMKKTDLAKNEIEDLARRLQKDVKKIGKSKIDSVIESIRNSDFLKKQTIQKLMKRVQRQSQKSKGRSVGAKTGAVNEAPERMTRENSDSDSHNNYGGTSQAGAPPSNASPLKTELFDNARAVKKNSEFEKLESELSRQQKTAFLKTLAQNILAQAGEIGRSLEKRGQKLKSQIPNAVGRMKKSKAKTVSQPEARRAPSLSRKESVSKKASSSSSPKGELKTKRVSKNDGRKSNPKPNSKSNPKLDPKSNQKSK